MWGAFFQPKNLHELPDQGLLDYRDECDRDLRRIEQELAYLDGRRSELNKDFTSDGIIVVGGVVLAGVGIAATAIVTFGGALALAGGAFSLIGAHRYGNRLVERRLVADEVRSRRESIAFLASELKRVEDELDRRGIR